jgi:hypothetical protein
VPRPLLALLAVAAIQAVAWAILVPPLQGPDEIEHVGYTQKLVEDRTIPWRPSGGGVARVSTEARVALAWGGVEALQGNPPARPPGSQVAVREWEQHNANYGRAQRRDGGTTSAMTNPPLYYLYEAVPYVAFVATGFFDRALAMRLWDLPLLLAFIALTWLLVGELFAGRRWSQMLATGVVVVQPQVVQEGAVVGPDILLAAIWTGFLYLAVVALRRGPTRGRIVGLVGLAALSCLTHARGVSIVAPLALVLALLWWRATRPAWGRSQWVALAAGGTVAAAAIGYAMLRYTTGGNVSVTSGRQFASYLWQFYLPSLPGMHAPPGPPWDVRDVFVDRLWSGMLQFEIGFKPGILDALAWISLAVAALAVARLIARRRSVSWDVVAVIAVAGVAYMLQLHLSGFKSVFGGSPDPVLTGRYLITLMAVFGAALVLAVSWLPRRAAHVVGGGVLAALGVLELAVFGLVLERFYA